MKAWNVKYKHQTIPTIKGNDYEIGFALGEIFCGQYKKFKHLKKQLKKPEINEYLTWLMPTLRNDYRCAYDEICGRADGSGVDVKLILLGLCQQELFDKAEGKSTSMIVASKQNMLLAHNIDGVFDKHNVRVVRIQRKAGGDSYQIADPNSLATSSLFIGKDLVFSLNYLYFEQKNLKFVPKWALFKLLTCCKSFDELLKIVKETPISTACGINVCDLKLKKFYYIEKVLDKFDLKDVAGVNLHTNHFLAKKFLALRPEFAGTSTSISRQFMANGLLSGRSDVDAEEAYKILTYYGTCDFNSIMQKANTGNDVCTFGTYILDLKNKTSCLHIQNKQKTTFDLDLPKF